MKLGLMQPYFFPYIGYWQLMNSVDTYVVFDEVAYIKRGYANRNSILINGESHYFNIQIKGASQNKSFSEIEIMDDPRFVNKTIRTIENAYSKAPYYAQVIDMVESILLCKEKFLVEYLLNSFAILREYMGISSDIVLSSSIKIPQHLKAQNRVIAICKELGADEYYNSYGGVELYSKELFDHNGIKLSFLKPKDIVYKQFGEKFIPNLSILDVMMFNSQEDVKRLLKEYTFL